MCIRDRYIPKIFISKIYKEKLYLFLQKICRNILAENS
jgi:hypothetical protein